MYINKPSIFVQNGRKIEQDLSRAISVSIIKKSFILYIQIFKLLTMIILFNILDIVKGLKITVILYNIQSDNIMFVFKYKHINKLQIINT